MYPILYIYYYICHLILYYILLYIYIYHIILYYIILYTIHGILYIYIYIRYTCITLVARVIFQLMGVYNHAYTHTRNLTCTQDPPVVINSRFELDNKPLPELPELTELDDGKMYG